ncbi:hypothetical protein LC612_08230 [Nostoc sp. CHAB 5834]|nr:hypothetical protein [Nostoc sp. CHAB 5834]
MISTNINGKRDEAAESDGGEPQFFENTLQTWRWDRRQTDLHNRTFLGFAVVAESGCETAINFQVCTSGETRVRLVDSGSSRGLKSLLRTDSPSIVALADY